jgi:threonine dehydrogenase-like Zn-dependent dehydrogenase
MQTRVYLRPPKKILAQHPDAGTSGSGHLVPTVNHKTIRGADLHLVKSATAHREPERILDNESAGFVDKKGPAISDL